MTNPVVATEGRRVLTLTSLASFMVALDSLVVATSLSTIRSTFGTSFEQLEWVVNAYGLTLAVLLITGAALGDRFGRRRMFATGLGLFVLASVACALSGSVTALITARAIQGAAAALVMPLAMALLSAAFSPEERARALGFFGAVTGLAVLGGPIIGGLVVEGLAWQWIFWLNVPLGVVMIPLVLRHIPESFGADARFDVCGVALITAGALGLVWGLMRGNNTGWMSGEVLTMLAAGIALTLAFVLWSARAVAPMVPMRLFRTRAFAASNLANFLLYATLYGALFFTAQFLQIAQGHGPLGAGLRMLPWTATLFVIAPIAGNLVSRIGERPLIVAGLALQSLGFGWLALVTSADLPFVQMIAPLVAAGCGVSMAMPAAQSAILGAVTRTELGKASGVLNMLRFLGGVFGVATLGAVFASTGTLASPQSFSAGFTAAMGACAALSLFGAMAGLALPHARMIAARTGEAAP
ncbi:DHA2 family efflux MFS transporter permease subunit [Bradyrhizobium sp. LHD-71]|uniref:DHA2 family efflux MFS transporter permease subunit n=1 Tax=Bradyrhizobium sp. LHD-71 TaxID=3072141 RepID=UPI00280E8EE7|nr:DHA2 family efflux MFS transporter permease subunit [Bradyrhizobium sp. LHD-71]MDQ8729093.1 DHA2 family efflux MFS transporter permease subunit [Bradyrhizobium sp. LHD-71]